MKNPSSALSDTIRTYEEALQNGVHIGDYETLKKLRYARTLADNITHHEADTAIIKNYPVIELDRLIVTEIKRILRINV